MLRLISLSILLAFTFTVGAAQAENFELRFWDGTFAYNQLIVKSNPHQRNIVTMVLSGSQINLASQIEGLPQIWSHRDRMEFSMRKSDCETLDVQNKEIACATDRIFVGNLTWQTSQRIAKTYSGIVENISILATDKFVTVKFKVPSDEDFTPHQEEVTVSFPVSFF